MVLTSVPFAFLRVTHHWAVYCPQQITNPKFLHPWQAHWGLAGVQSIWVLEGRTCRHWVAGRPQVTASWCSNHQQLVCHCIHQLACIVLYAGSGIWCWFVPLFLTFLTVILAESSWSRTICLTKQICFSEAWTSTKFSTATKLLAAQVTSQAEQKLLPFATSRHVKI